jgi:hypothetical protein
MKSNLSLRTVLAAASLSLVTALAVARSADLQEPQRTEIVATDGAKASTPTLVRRAIILGGQHHGWKPVADKPGVLTLTASSGAHEVSVDVLYDAHGFQVKFKGSANMNEEKSGERITVHPKVNKWLSDLNDDIRSAAVEAANKAN